MIKRVNEDDLTLLYHILLSKLKDALVYSLLEYKTLGSVHVGTIKIPSWTLG